MAMATIAGQRPSAGTGSGRRFSKEIFDKFQEPLVAQIQKQLDAGNVFNSTAEKNTKQVAKDTGKVCRMMSRDATVSLDTFTLVFTFMQKFHPACPIAGGGGGWCEI